MQKIKKYSVIKNKIIEQILENMNDDSNLITLSEGFTNSAENNGILEYNEDLAMSDINDDHRIKKENTEVYNEPTQTSNFNENLKETDNNGIIGYTSNFVSNDESILQNKDGLSAFEQSSGTSAFSFI